MENSSYSLADLAAATGSNSGFGGSSAWILIILFAMIFGWGGNGFGGRGELGNYATAASQQEILFGQQFQNLGSMINKVGDGISSLGYSQLQQMDANTASINGNVTNEGRNIQMQLSNCCCENQRNTDALRYDMATMNANTNAAFTAQTQKILDALAQNKIDTLQARVNQLETQNMFCGVPKINPYLYGVYPYSTTGCNCNAI